MTKIARLRENAKVAQKLLRKSCAPQHRNFLLGLNLKPKVRKIKIAVFSKQHIG